MRAGAKGDLWHSQALSVSVYVHKSYTFPKFQDHTRFASAAAEALEKSPEHSVIYEAVCSVHNRDGR